MNGPGTNHPVGTSCVTAKPAIGDHAHPRNIVGIEVIQNYHVLNLSGKFLQ
jgi:hypothetical protein